MPQYAELLDNPAHPVSQVSHHAEPCNLRKGIDPMRILVLLENGENMILEGVDNPSDAGEIREAALQAMENTGQPLDYVLAADCVMAVNEGNRIIL